MWKIVIITLFICSITLGAGAEQNYVGQLASGQGISTPAPTNESSPGNTENRSNSDAVGASLPSSISAADSKAKIEQQVGDVVNGAVSSVMTPSAAARGD
jgi:hypothetical protein